MQPLVAGLLWLALTSLLGVAEDVRTTSLGSLGGSFRPGPACARALLLVAHFDDETLLAGEALAGSVVALPGGCRQVFWRVIVVAGADAPRKRDNFRKALDHARIHGNAAQIQEEVWDFKECDVVTCMHFHPGPKKPSLREKLKRLFIEGGGGMWDYVVTHNSQGEVGHYQHIGLHNHVKDALREHCDQLKAGAAARLLPLPLLPELLVFNPMPEINASMSQIKKFMVRHYLLGDDEMSKLAEGGFIFYPSLGTQNNFLADYDALMRYTEHIVPEKYFARPAQLTLTPCERSGLYFQYLWSNSISWDRLGAESFTSLRAKQVADDFLNHVLRTSCTSPDVPRYPHVCSKIRGYLSSNGWSDVIFGFMFKMQQYWDERFKPKIES
mmetsp:Transcript_63566/g.207306  ORF Transcript_63566/g.207306 Transcript_63566/m.207306 type:complete len:384 (+) Transcript_63566:53-1204(+)